MKLVNMRLPKPKRKRISKDACASIDYYPKYPCGLEINLNADSLKNLDISNLDLSKPIKIEAYADVISANVSIHKRYDESGPEQQSNLSLQITDIGLSNKDNSTKQSKTTTLRGLKKLLIKSE